MKKLERPLMKEEFNRDEELENLNEMVRERLGEKQLNDLQWAKEFMDAYERKRRVRNRNKQSEEINRVL